MACEQNHMAAHTPYTFRTNQTAMNALHSSCKVMYTTNAVSTSGLHSWLMSGSSAHRTRRISGDGLEELLEDG